MRFFRRTAVAMITTAVAIVVTGGLANASDDGVDVENVAATIAAVAPEAGAVEEMIETDDGFVVASDGGRVDVPIETGSPVEIASSKPAVAPLAVHLPELPDVREAQEAEDGTVVYASDSAVSLAVQPLAEGSTRFLSILQDASAPERFEYRFEGRSLRLEDDGSVQVLHEGEFAGAVAAPWAYDARGVAVPTRYEVNGEVLTQVIDHFGKHFQYPITADPWYSFRYFSSITVDTYKSQPRVNLKLTAWGWAIYASGAAGQASINLGGWAEAQTWSAAVRNALSKPSMKQQFECHALGALAAGTWNLERFRPNRTTTWLRGVGTHHCNWTTPNLY